MEKRKKESTVVRVKGEMKTEQVVARTRSARKRERKRKREGKKERRDRKRKRRRRRRRNECGGNGLQRPRRPFT